MKPEQIKETLMILQEECGELTQAISKCFRFGKDSEWDGTTNKRRLESEIGDVLAMIDILVESGYVSDDTLNASRKAKKEKEKLKTLGTNLKNII